MSPTETGIENAPKTLAELLARALEGKTQIELARQLQVSQYWISARLRGDRTTIPRLILERVSKGLNISSAEIERLRMASN